MQDLNGTVIHVLVHNVKTKLVNSSRNTVDFLMFQMLPYASTMRSQNRINGFLGDVWDIIQDQLNFTYTPQFFYFIILKPHIKNFRSAVRNVDYDEGLQIINYKQADVMLAAAVANNIRKNVEFSQPYFYNW